MPKAKSKKTSAGKTLLEVNDLCMYFDTAGKRVKASEHISFDIKAGETFGLVGESGSGKSTIGKCIIGLNRATSGSITFEGKELTGIKSKKEYIEKTRDIQMIFQDPMSSLNPKKQVGQILNEAMSIQHIGKTRAERDKLAAEALERVGIPPEYASRYPSGFSGGQRQRIGIGRALVGSPKLIIDIRENNEIVDRDDHIGCLVHSRSSLLYCTIYYVYSTLPFRKRALSFKLVALGQIEC